MASEDNNSILLESGTNELEVLVFQVGVYRLGINVAKVREILTLQNITSLPSCHPAVMGCFRLRDQVVSCVSLHKKFGQEQKQLDETGRNVILTEFNQYQTAFYADCVERIYRISWEKILPVPPYLLNFKCPITGITVLNGELVIMLDFESIAAEICQLDQGSSDVENVEGIDRSQLRIVFADDSPTVRAAVEGSLRRNGYKDVLVFSDGRQAWEWLKAEAAKVDLPHEIAGAIVSDVEMPSMDGLHLTKRIKEHELLKYIPTILFSSILTPDNQKKGETVGADAQITKPELVKVIELIDQLTAKSFKAWSEREPSAPSVVAPTVAAPVPSAVVSTT